MAVRPLSAGVFYFFSLWGSVGFPMHISTRLSSHLKRCFYELFEFKEVLFNSVSQEHKRKYKRTSLGYLWSLLNPLLQLTVLALIFSQVMRVQIRDYTLYLFAGMVPFTFFQNAINACASSFIEAEHLIQKIYVPKLLFPLGKTISKKFDFLMALFALLIIGLLMGFSIPWTTLLLPGALISLFMFSFGVGLIVAVWNVFMRDIQYLVTVFLQILYFATPILYPLSMMPERFHWLLKLNPLYIQLQLFHLLIYEGTLPTIEQWAIAYGVSLSTLFLGLLTLVKQEDELVFRL